MKLIIGFAIGILVAGLFPDETVAVSNALKSHVNDAANYIADRTSDGPKFGDIVR